MACHAVLYSSTLPHKKLDLRKNIIEDERCVMIFSIILYEIFLILRRVQRDMTKNVYWSSRKVHFTLDGF